MTSQIYRATVSHSRYTPVKHSFTYPVYLYSFDLDELSTLNDRHWFFGYNRIRLIGIHDKDYLKNNIPGSIREKLFKILADEGIDTSAIRNVKLFTGARFLNYIFNPVSFFICLGDSGTVKCLVTEVNNTFRERHLYIIHEQDLIAGSTVRNEDDIRYTVTRPKSFHVSPFNDMLGDYKFRFSVSDSGLDMNISIIRDQKTAFHARIVGKLIPFSPSNVAKTLLRFPFSAWLTYPRIVWQAAKLYFIRRLSVFTKPYPSSPYTIVHAPATWIEDFSRKILERHLEKIQKGTLQIIYPDGICRTFRGQYDHDSVRAMINIKSPRFFRKLIFGGDVGFGESFMLGDWESDDLVGLLSLLISNRDYIDPRLIRFNAISRRINTLLHRLRKNTPFGSKKNIQAHYDLSNDMFKGFLDRTMSYSCAIFKSDSESLEDAQLNKINRILEQAELKADDHVLEIGCGWGSLAIEGVKKSGCRFTCLTLSEEQKEYAEDIIRREGLSDKITVKLCDYRAIDGQFDKIISIEMVEAVGREYLSEYFRICEGLLKPGGKIVIQAITLDNERISQYQKNCDWIQKYIFPGCFVPSLEMLQSTVNSSTRLKISDAYEMRGQYEKTLERWRKEFSIAIDQIKSFGFDMTFIRKWIYYFSYCQAGFTSRALSTYQMTLQKN